MRFLKALALICGLVAPAAANQYFNSPVTSTATGSAWQSISGQFYLAASSASVSSTTALVPTKSTWTITMDGATGNVWAKLYTAVTGFVGNLTGNVIGNVTGNLTGTASLATLATTATTATNLAVGTIGQIAYQIGTALTGFLPSMGSGGIIIGNGAGVVPSTGTLAGTASQVVVTKSGAGLTLSLASTINVPTSGNAATATAFASAPTTCSAQAATGIDVNGNAVGCFSAGTGDAVKSATQTFSGANTFAGGVTFSSGVVFSQWGSTSTTIPGTQNSASPTWVSITGSTITTTFHGGHLFSGFSCNLAISVGGDSCYAAPTYNGQYARSGSATVGLMMKTEPNANVPTSQSFVYLSTFTYTGTVTGTLFFRSAQSVGCDINRNSDQACSFWMEEIP